MKINRFFPRHSNTKIQDEETTQKHVKSFEEILQEEHALLMQIISESTEIEDIKQFYKKYNPRMTDYMFPEELP